MIIYNLYYLCNEAINNCQKYTSSDKCDSGIDGYIRINNVKSTCHLKGDINIDEYYIIQRIIICI